MQATHCIELQENMPQRWHSIKSYCFNTNISNPFLNFKLSIRLNQYFCSVGQAEENPMKKELLRCVDKIPAYCHQLMFTSRSLAVGQSACCRKVSDVKSVNWKKDFQLLASFFFSSLYLKSNVATKHRDSRKLIQRSWGQWGGGRGKRRQEKRGWGQLWWNFSLVWPIKLCNISFSCLIGIQILHLSHCNN